MANSSVAERKTYGAAAMSQIHQSRCPSNSQCACMLTSPNATRMPAAANAKGDASSRASRTAACRRSRSADATHVRMKTPSDSGDQHG